jgi:hypothetical protein
MLKYSAFLETVISLTCLFVECLKMRSVTWTIMRGTNCNTVLSNYMLFSSLELERILTKALVVFFEVLCRYFQRGIEENFGNLSRSSLASCRYILSRLPTYISIEELKVKGLIYPCLPMKTCRRSRDTRLLILTSVIDTDNGQHKAPTALPLK